MDPRGYHRDGHDVMGKDGHLSQDRAWSDLGHGVPVHLDRHDAFEQQEQLGAGGTLLGQDRARLELAEGRARIDDQARQPALERCLDGGHQRRGFLIPPRRVPAERVPPPAVEVDQPGLGDQLAPVVVDPVAREGARADDLMLARPVGVDREGQR